MQVALSLFFLRSTIVKTREIIKGRNERTPQIVQVGIGDRRCQIREEQESRIVPLLLRGHHLDGDTIAFKVCIVMFIPVGLAPKFGVHAHLSG